MGTTRISALAVLSVLLLAAPGRAEPLTYKHEGQPLFSIVYPESWYFDTDFIPEAKDAGTYQGGTPAIRIVEAMPNDDSRLWFGIWVAPASVTTLDKGLEYVSSLDGHLFSDVVASEPEKSDFNGMAAVSFYGTAQRQGEDVEYAVALFEPSEGVLAVALYVGQPQTWEDHRDDLAAMVQSIRPAAD